MIRGRSNKRKLNVSDIPAGLAECNICGERMPAEQEAMLFHLADKHPLDVLTSKSFALPLIDWAFDLGANLAGKFR